MIRDDSTDYSVIYDYFYKKFADKVNYKIANSTKTTRIGKIFKSLQWNDKVAIFTVIKYGMYSSKTKEKLVGLTNKELYKTFESACKHMYNPLYIKIAVPSFYTIRSKKKNPLCVEDFDDKKYILNALKKSGIIYREQLLRHLSVGWYYLWTIPRCGDNARQIILQAIDRWNNK